MVVELEKRKGLSKAGKRFADPQDRRAKKERLADIERRSRKYSRVQEWGERFYQ